MESKWSDDSHRQFDWCAVSQRWQFFDATVGRFWQAGSKGGHEMKFTSEMPFEEGCYFMKCEENDFKADFVQVYYRADTGLLCCDIPAGSGFQVKSVHDGLTNVTWAHAISFRSERSH